MLLDTTVILIGGICPPPWPRGGCRPDSQWYKCPSGPTLLTQGASAPISSLSTSPFCCVLRSAAVTLPQGEKNQIRGLLTGTSPLASKPCKPYYLLASNVSCSQGESLSLCFPHSKAWPKVSPSLMQSFQKQQSMCDKLGLQWTDFSTDQHPSWASMLFLPKNGSISDSPLHVYHCYHESVETLIITHSLKLSWRPGDSKAGCYCLLG